MYWAGIEVQELNFWKILFSLRVHKLEFKIISLIYSSEAEFKAAITKYCYLNRTNSSLEIIVVYLLNIRLLYSYFIIRIIRKCSEAEP